MRRKFLAGGVVMGLAFVLSATSVRPQSGHQDPSQQKPTLDKQKQKPGGLTPEGQQPDAPAKPATNPEEEAAYKAFVDAPQTDMVKRQQLGEEFVAKYPQSRYVFSAYSALVLGYFVTNQADKVKEVGAKAIAVNPNDVNTLAMMSQVMSRTVDPKAPTAAQTMDKAEQYAKHAIEVLTTMAKPENATEEGFAAAKAQVLSMSHSSIGLVDLRRGKFSEAIPELDQAVKLVSEPDQVNLYLLGLANENATHYDDAVAAYTKCGALQGSLQANCKQNLEKAKKLAATQLSSPK